MRRISVCVLFLAVNTLATLSNEEDVRSIIESSESASGRAALDAQVLINSLAKESVKIKMNMKDVPIQRSDKKCLSKQTNPIGSGKCGMNLEIPKSQNSENKKSSAQLIIFVSSGMPQQSIKALGDEAHKICAKIVFCGLIGGSFVETQSYMQELGIIAEIDPTKFDDYQIVQVPTFILVHNKAIDRVAGHVSIWEALEQFKRKGELKDEAKKLYDELKHHSVRGVSS